MVRGTKPREENLETLLDVDSLNQETAEQLLDEYEAPGYLFQELNHYHFTRDETDPDLGLPVESSTQLYHDMSRAGITYYTGIIEVRPDPPDGYQITGPEMDTESYELVGREEAEDGEPAPVHFYRLVDEDLLEVLETLQDYEGNLSHEDRHRFNHSPVPRFQHFINQREWDIFREPDYEDLRNLFEDSGNSGGVAEVSLGIENGQSTWSDWEQ